VASVQAGRGWTTARVIGWELGVDEGGLGLGHGRSGLGSGRNGVDMWVQAGVPDGGVYVGTDRNCVLHSKTC
jgi:hypothetical protein